MESFEIDIRNCVAVMNSGGTFLYPTDTVWGLGCDATEFDAVAKISEVKNRPSHKSYIVLMADVQMLRHYLLKPMEDLEDFVNGQEGATTIIYDGIKGIAENVLAVDKSLGIRIPKDEFCKQLLNQYGKPLVSTSANLSGESNPSFYSEISPIVKQRVDYVCQWRQEDKDPKEPSSIIKLNTDGSIVKIR